MDLKENCYHVNKIFARNSKIEFTKSKGLYDQNKLSEAGRLYELNEMVMELPDFRTLFIERATAPFFVFQATGLIRRHQIYM